MKNRKNVIIDNLPNAFEQPGKVHGCGLHSPSWFSLSINSRISILFSYFGKSKKLLSFLFSVTAFFFYFLICMRLFFFCLGSN